MYERLTNGPNALVDAWVKHQHTHTHTYKEIYNLDTKKITQHTQSNTTAHKVTQQLQTKAPLHYNCFDSINTLCDTDDDDVDVDDGNYDDYGDYDDYDEEGDNGDYDDYGDYCSANF